LTPIDVDSFLLMAAKFYAKGMCLSYAEFEEDLDMIQWVRGDMTRYITKREPNILRQAMNKLVILSNCFGTEGSQRLLFFRSQDRDDHMQFLRTVYLHLGTLKEPLYINDELVIDTKFQILDYLKNDLNSLLNSD
jgi:hypothetical protein